MIPLPLVTTSSSDPPSPLPTFRLPWWGMAKLAVVCYVFITLSTWVQNVFANVVNDGEEIGTLWGLVKFQGWFLRELWRHVR
jgi:hypothetical protein